MGTRRKTCWSAVLTLVLLAAILGGEVSALAEYHWLPPEGQWLDPNGWNPVGVPTSGDVAYVTNGGTCTIYFPMSYTARAGTLYIYDPTGTSKVVQDGADATFGQILPGLPEGNGGTYELKSANTLQIDSNAWIGNVGTGYFIQSAGTTNVALDMRLGALPLGHGTCTLSNGSLTIGGLLIVGDQGTGTFVEERGTCTVMGTLAVASQAGGRGTVTLSDGLLDVRGNALIGHNGTATFTQNGGTCRVASAAVFVLGNAPGASGTYTLVSGALEAGTMYVGGSGGGAGGSGSFEERGGTVTASALIIGSGTASGTYRLGGTSTLTVAGGITVGVAGRLELYGGTLNAPSVSLSPGATVALGNDCDVVATLVGGPVVFSGLGGACLQIVNEKRGTQTSATVQVARLDVGVAGGGGGGGGGGCYTLRGTGRLVTPVLNVGGAETDSFFDWYDPESSLEAPHVNILANGYMNVYRDWEYGGALDIQGTLDVKTNVLTIGGETGTANVAGAILGDTVRIYYGSLTMSGGHSCVGNFLNGWEEGGGGGSGALSITGGELEATFVGNGGYFEQLDGRVLAGTFENQMYGEVVLEGGTLEAETYINRGYGGMPQAMTQGGGGHTTYVRGNATVMVDNLINEGEYRLTHHGTIRGKANLQGDFDNRGSFYMDVEIEQGKGGGHGQPRGGTFEDRLINRGYFEYTAGDFNGVLEHWAGADGFSYVGDFTAGRGIYNYGELQANPYSKLTGNGTDGIVNYGTLILPGATLAGTKVVNDYGGVMYAKGTIATAFENNGALELEGTLTVTGTTTNRGSIVAESLERYAAQGAFSNSGLVEFRPAEGVPGGGVLAGPGQVTNETGGSIQMLGGGSITAPLINNGVIEARDSQNLVITNLSASTGEIRAANARLNVQSAFTNSGAVVLENATVAGGAITNQGTIVGRGSAVNTVASAVTNQGLIRCEPLLVGGTPVPSSVVFTAPGCTNAAGARIEAPEKTTIVFNQGLATNAGTILLAGGTFDNNSRAMTNSGTVSGHGTLRTGGLTNAAGHNIGTGSGNLDIYGTMVNAAGANVTTQAGCTTTFYNFVSGGGHFPGLGTVVFLDGYSPGESPAEVAFGGDLALAGPAALFVEVGGTAPGTGYDRLDVAGDLVLGGTLNVALIYGFQPQGGQAFDLLDWGGVSGAFEAVNLPPLGDGLTWDASGLYATGTLQVVPEPASAALLLMGLAAAVLRRRAR